MTDMFIDNSAIEHYTTCRRSFEYSNVKKRVLSEGKAALLFGGAMHKALEAHYRGRSLDECLLSAYAYLDDAGYNPEPDEWRTKAALSNMFQGYLKSQLDMYETLKYEQTPGEPQLALELPFAIPLRKMTVKGETFHVIYTGRIDRIAINPESRECYVWDFKTTSMMGPRFFDEFTNSQQMLGYMWATQTLLQIPLAGFVIDALCGRKPTKTGVPYEFVTQRFFVDPDQVVEWRLNLDYLLDDIERDLNRGYFPRETKWCVGKYGRCQYFDVCSIPAAGRDALLYSHMFQDNKWSPLNQ